MSFIKAEYNYSWKWDRGNGQPKIQMFDMRLQTVNDLWSVQSVCEADMCLQNGQWYVIPMTEQKEEGGWRVAFRNPVLNEPQQSILVKAESRLESLRQYPDPKKVARDIVSFELYTGHPTIILTSCIPSKKIHLDIPGSVSLGCVKTERCQSIIADWIANLINGDL